MCLFKVDVNDEAGNSEGSLEETFTEADVYEQEETSKNSAEVATSADQTNDTYEDLLRIEGPVDDIDTPPAVDLRGNIKALKNALNHPLVFNEPTEKEQEKQTYTRRSQVLMLLGICWIREEEPLLYSQVFFARIG